MSLKAIVRAYISQIRPRMRTELEWFGRQPSLSSAIEYAALAVDSRGKRYSHQRRLKKVNLERARQALLADSAAIERSDNFDDLFTRIEAILEPISGVGELYVYD